MVADAGFEAVLPAHAGMIPGREDGVPSRQGAPRTCGDDPAADTVRRIDMRCSPHMRG